MQIRHRYCDNPMPKYGGAKCDGLNIKTRKCDLGPCPGQLSYQIYSLK